MFAFFEKKYFFPALWSSGAGTQGVGPRGAWNPHGKWSVGVLEYWGRRLQESVRAAGGVVRSGQKCVGKWVQLGKGGKKVGNRTGFSHLFPDVSTQVVDFPLLSRLRVFCGMRVERGGGQWTVDNWQWIANRGNESNRTNGTNLARTMIAKSPRKFGLFHDVTRKSAKVRTDQGRKSAIVRIFTGGNLFSEAGDY